MRLKERSEKTEIARPKRKHRKTSEGIFSFSSFFSKGIFAQKCLPNLAEEAPCGAAPKGAAPLEGLEGDGESSRLWTSHAQAPLRREKERETESFGIGCACGVSDQGVRVGTGLD